MKTDKVYRTKKGYLGGLLAFLTVIFYGLGAWVLSRAAGSSELIRTGMILMLCGAPFVLYTLLLMLRGQIKLDQTGITITKAWRRRIAYGEIQCIEFARRSMIFKGKTYRVRLKNKRKIIIDGDLFDSALLDDLVKIDARLTSKEKS